MGSKSNDWSLHKNREMWRQTGDFYVSTEAAVRVIQLQAKEYQRLPAATRGEEKARENSFLELFMENGPANISAPFF